MNKQETHIIRSPSLKQVAEICQKSEEYFHTESDEKQFEANLKNIEVMLNFAPETVVAEKVGNEFVGWSLALPTSNDKMQKFLSGEITERELGYDALDNPSFESLYLMTVFVRPDFRGRAIGYHLLSKQIDLFKNKYPSIESLYAWAWSDNGAKLINYVNDKNDTNILFKD